MGVHGCAAVYMGVQRCKWVYMGVQRCTWVYSGVHGCTSALKPGRVIRVTFSPGHPGHIFSGSSGSDPVYNLSGSDQVYNLSGSDPDWIT